MLKNDDGSPLLFFGAIRSIHTPALTVWVVTPGGVHKPLYVTSGVKPRQLEVDWRIDPQDGTIIGVETVVIAARYYRLGWRLLRELYAEEGRLGDYATFLEYERQCRQGVTHQIPDEYLPDAMVRMRSEAKAKEGKAQLPPPQRAAVAVGKPVGKGKKGQQGELADPDNPPGDAA